MPVAKMAKQSVRGLAQALEWDSFTKLINFSTAQAQVCRKACFCKVNPYVIGDWWSVGNRMRMRNGVFHNFSKDRVLWRQVKL